MKTYISKAANDAKNGNYGDENYWDYLENHALELSERFSNEGNTTRANEMLKRSLSEALLGNDGE